MKIRYTFVTPALTRTVITLLEKWRTDPNHCARQILSECDRGTDFTFAAIRITLDVIRQHPLNPDTLRGYATRVKNEIDAMHPDRIERAYRLTAIDDSILAAAQ